MWKEAKATCFMVLLIHLSGLSKTMNKFSTADIRVEILPRHLTEYKTGVLTTTPVNMISSLWYDKQILGAKM
jgi:hypothetical protein